MGTVVLVYKTTAALKIIKFIFNIMNSNVQSTTKISLTFVRHGQSEGNKNWLIQGQGNTPLSEEGKKQCELAGLALSQVPFDIIYSSDQERAYDTATIIASKNEALLSVKSDENDNIIEDNKLLRERTFGIFDLRPHKEFIAAAEESGYKKHVDLYEFVPEGGEGLPDVKKRAEKFLKCIFESVTKNVLFQTRP